MSTHTPGPWYADYDGATYSVLNSADDGALLVCDHIGNKADVRLIIAAPEMLAALQWIAEHYPASKAGQCAMDAIAKAEGHEP